MAIVLLVLLCLPVFAAELSVPRSEMTVSASSEQPTRFSASKAIDGNNQTMWHSKWYPIRRKNPHVFTLDLGRVYPLTRLEYTPRQFGRNGRLLTGTVSVGVSLDTLREVTSYELANRRTIQFIPLDSSRGRYIRIHIATSSSGYGSIAELRVFYDDTLLPTPDTESPTVMLESVPSPVSGQVMLTAIATDNVGIVGVMYTVDGNVLAESTVPPTYSVVWDTTGWTNGEHTIVATARDAALNIALDGRQVVVGNTIPSPAVALRDWLLSWDEYPFGAERFYLYWRARAETLEYRPEQRIDLGNPIDQQIIAILRVQDPVDDTCFVLTALHTELGESGFSNEVCSR